LTDEIARRPPTAEHIRLSIQPPYHTEPAVNYYYPTPRAPVTDELSVTVWVRATRPGVQLRARLVLPRERHPDRVDEPLTTLVPGDTLTLFNRWQPLKINQPGKLLRQQQQVMRAMFNRDLDFTGAYIDRLILNLYPGQPGQIDVYIDDLEIGPVENDRPA